MTDILTRLAALTAKPASGILPCPTCDGVAKTWVDGRTHHRRWRAGCPAIGCAVVKGGTEAQATARWNTRPREQALITLVQEAAGEIERLKEAFVYIEKACLCGHHTTHAKGFEYGEKHARLGAPSQGSRWLTPRERINALRLVPPKNEQAVNPQESAL
jgi:hypothetical protein